MRSALRIPAPWRPLVLTLGFVLVPATLSAQPWERRAASTATAEGYARGFSAGEEDARRGRAYEFADEADYRRGDAEYRAQYGSRDRYRDEFRQAYADGYAAGYRGWRDTRGQNDPYARDGYGGRGGWGSNRGPGGSGPIDRYDLAFRAGVNDGYEEGLDDARDGRRFDPIGEKRYRSGDHGYQNRYGSREAWKVRYRDGFTRGYEEGYQDGLRYDRRYDGRYDRRPEFRRPWWWPF